MAKAKILNVLCDIYNTEDMRTEFDRLMSSAVCNAIMFLNINAFYIAQKSREYRKILNDAEVMINDGVGIDKLAKSYNVEFKENMNGTDLIPKFIEWAHEADETVYLLGATEENVKAAAEKLTAKYGEGFVAGYHDGFIFESNPDQYADFVHLKKVAAQYDEAVVEDINRSGAKLVILGMGMPLQENWINSYKDKLTNGGVVVAGGAIIDYISENVKRSPKIFIKLKLEWLYRLLRNPKRLLERNLKGVFALYRYRGKRVVSK